ncbi:MAG: class I SAM-dependent methyltransferase [Pseudomonadota bacterium]
MKRPLDSCLFESPRNGAVLDVGCFGFARVAQAAGLGRGDLRHAGVDFTDPGNVPVGVDFRRADLNHERLPFDDDSFDLVVASHVLEHVRDPIGLVIDCLRVCRPGGRVYIEAPSERALFLPSMPFKFEAFHSLSFFDDPTHLSRPWTPQALFRLARLLGCEPEVTKHQISWLIRILSPALIPLTLILRDARRFEYWSWLTVGWSCYAVIRKPASLQGAPALRYSIPPRGR